MRNILGMFTCTTYYSDLDDWFGVLNAFIILTLL